MGTSWINRTPTMNRGATCIADRPPDGAKRLRPTAWGLSALSQSLRVYIHHAPQAARQGNVGVMNHARTKGFHPNGQKSQPRATCRSWSIVLKDRRYPIMYAWLMLEFDHGRQTSVEWEVRASLPLLVARCVPLLSCSSFYKFTQPLLSS